jgi:hypothetical protein
MTHFFSVTENEMSLLSREQKKFDILKFSRSVSIGDTIIYQLEEIRPTEDDHPQNGLPQEYTVKIDYLFEDTEGALKKGYAGVGFTQHS